MEIERKNTRKVQFDALRTGDVFLDEDSDVMMVVDQDYGLGNGESYDGYAIDLKTGLHYGYNADDEVIKVTAKLTVID